MFFTFKTDNHLHLGMPIRSVKDILRSGIRQSKRRKQSRCASALLICLFVMALTSMVLVGVLNTTTSQLTAMRNTVDYERALYLAGAGAHHALAELEADPNWAAGIPATEFPPGSGNTYLATVSPGPGATLLILGTGTAGSVTRSIQLTIETGQ